MKKSTMQSRITVHFSVLLFALLFSAMILSGSFADHFTPSYTTYDTTYEKILKMYLKVINGYGTANYGRHDLFNDAIYGADYESDYKTVINQTKRNTGFMLFDVNQDGTDELMIGSGGGWLYEVFTMDEGRVRELIRAGGYGMASSVYSCALLANGMFYRYSHNGAVHDYYETWRMNGTDKVSFVEGYHTDGVWDPDAQMENIVWYRSDAPKDRVTSSPGARVKESVAKDWIRQQEWNIYVKKFVPFSVYEKYPDDPWNVAVLSVNGAYNTTAKVKIRKEADANSKLVATKNVGTYVKVLDKEGEYFRIAFGNKEGYIRQEYITPLTYEIPADDNPGTQAELAEVQQLDEDSQPGKNEPDLPAESQEPYPVYGRTTGNKVNMRKETDKKSKLVETIRKKGTQIRVTGESADKDGTVWYQIEYNGKEGYVRSDFIDLEQTNSVDTAENGELYGLVIKKLATRSGPSPRFEDTGTYSVKGKRLRVYSRAYDPIENAWWVKVDVPYHGEIRTLWAWYTRFDSKTLPLESIPIDEDY